MVRVYVSKLGVRSYKLAVSSYKFRIKDVAIEIEVLVLRFGVKGLSQRV